MQALEQVKTRTNFNETAFFFGILNGNVANTGTIAVSGGAMTVPYLVLRGAQSDLLTPGTAQRMTERGPRASCISFDGVGHAPTLVAADQVAAVTEFLLAAEGVVAG